MPLKPPKPLQLDRPDTNLVEAARDNSALSGINASFRSGSEALSQNVTSNPLDFYDLSTYNLKLYMADPLEVNTELNQPPPNRIVLAASGITDIAFKDLDFITIMSLSNSVYTSTYTQFNFSLIEPLGCTFLDRIAEQAEKNGIDNFVKCPYWLEVNFVARDSDSGKPLKVLSGNPGPGGTAKDLKLTIPIKILEVKIDITNGATEYIITAVRYVDSATADTHAVTKQNIVIGGVGTVREFFEKLELEMNQINQELQSENAAFHNQQEGADQYAFVLGPEFADGEDNFIRPNALFEHAGDQATYDQYLFTKTDATVPAGTDLMRAIDMVMSATKYMEDGISPENSPGENENVPYEAKRLYRIEHNAEILGYDRGRGDYVRRFTYTVKKLTITGIYPNPGEAVDRTDLGLDNSEEKAGLLFKHYKFIYEGNKDVISFDCKLNTAWFLPLPRQYGNATGSASSSGPANNSASTNQDKLKHAKIKNKSEITRNLFSSETGEVEVYAQKPDGDLRPWPLTYYTAPGEDDQSGVLEGATDNRRSFVSSIFKSGMQGLGGDLLELNLVVRGDPDWLFVLNEQQIYIKFSMGLPSEPQEDGLIRKDKNNMINGYYRVLTVKNNFADGKFTQTIKAVRDAKVVDD